MTRDDDCRGELLARERRGQLPPEQRPALDAHLERCPSCRLARDLHADFEERGTVELRDALLIQRLAAAARRWAARPARTAFALRRRALAFAAALVLAGGSASAAVWWWRHPPTGAERRAPAVLAAAPATARPIRPAAVGAIESHAPVATAVAPAAFATPARPLAAGRAARAEAPVLPAALLRQASDARRAGDAERAIRFYRRLEREFPSSPEAVLSAVPLGGLLLDRDLPRAALSEFDRYLGSSRGGALIPEALFGRGRALGRLGDRDEERRTWQRLLADFPGSAYAPHARRRSTDLR